MIGRMNRFIGDGAVFNRLRQSLWKVVGSQVVGFFFTCGCNGGFKDATLERGSIFIS